MSLPPEFRTQSPPRPAGLNEVQNQILDQQQMRFLARNVKTKYEKDAVLAGIEEIPDVNLRNAVKDMLLPLLPKFEGET